MIEKQEYLDYLKAQSPRTSHIKTLVTAFVIGGLICCIGEAFKDIYTIYIPSLSKIQVAALTSITLIFIASLLTGLGVYDKIGKVAGAGSIVPITGFANSIVSPAMDFKREGLFYGIMSNMFVVAGPVVVSGVCYSVIIGIIYFCIEVFI